jgi:SAM-dependent methyltransferase
MATAHTYIMDDPREGQRLLDKADAGLWIEKYFSAHLPKIRSVLSVGCGPAVFLREIAESHPEIEAVGVDISSARIKDAEQRLGGLPNARVHVGNALALPFEANRFDLVFCRFLLEYLPDTRQAVREMKRVCNPGGKILLQDLDGQLVWHFPQDADLQEKTELVVGHLSKTGFDPFVGRKLFSLCLDAGLADVSVQVDPYHLYAGTIDDNQFSQWRTKLEIAHPQISSALGGDEAARKYSEQFLSYLKNPNTLTYSCLFTVTGSKLDR